MSDICTVFEYRNIDGDVSAELIAMREANNRSPNRKSGFLFVPEAVESELYEDIVHAVEVRMGGRVLDVLPIEIDKIEPVCGVKSRVEKPDNADNSNDSSLWVAYQTATHDPSIENPRKPRKLGEEGYWKYLFVREGLRVNDPQILSADEWSLCIVKPDAKEMKLEEDILERIAVNGLRVATSLEKLELPESHLDQIWPSVDANGNPLPPNSWWNATVDYMTSGPVDTLLVHGADASVAMKSLKNELRAERYGEDYQDDLSLPVSERVKSIIHTSDCDPELALNALGFWNRRELTQHVNGATLLDLAA